MSARGDNDVRRLEVTMRNAFGMRYVERVSQVHTEPYNLRDLKRMLFQPGVKALSLDVLHRDKVLSFRFSNFIDVSYMRMIETGRSSGLLDKPPHALFLDGHIPWQNLQRDSAVESRILREIDLAHPTRAQRLKNLIMPD